MTAISAAVLYRHPAAPAAVYRRRRVAVGAALVALLVLASLAGGWGRGAPGGGPLTASGGAAPATASLSLQTVSADTYVVVAGDTLWSIARGLQPEGDVRPLVDALAASRDGRPLQVGERIRLP